MKEAAEKQKSIFYRDIEDICNSLKIGAIRWLHTLFYSVRNAFWKTGSAHRHRIHAREEKKTSNLDNWISHGSSLKRRWWWWWWRYGRGKLWLLGCCSLAVWFFCPLLFDVDVTGECVWQNGNPWSMKCAARYAGAGSAKIQRNNEMQHNGLIMMWMWSVCNGLRTQLGAHKTMQSDGSTLYTHKIRK